MMETLSILSEGHGLLLGLVVAAVAVLNFWVLYFKARRDLKAKETEARVLKAKVSASLDGIVTSNEKGEVIDFNEAAEKIFGWSRDEILGQKMEDTFIPHQHRKAHANGMQQYLKFREPHVIDAGRIELTALRKTGEEFPIELNITCAKQKDGDIFIGYLRDISEQKINKQKLIKAREQAERTDRAKSRFLTLMSHEMRTPLNGILGVLDLLGTTQLNKKQQRFVQVAAASGEILLEHVNEALDVTRIETGELLLSKNEFSMPKQIERTVNILRPLAEEKGLELEVEIDPVMDRSFFGDAGRIGQILTNLIGNAIKFTSNGMILVKVKGIHGSGKTETEISVMDTGPGIAKEDLESIFEEFVVLSRSSGRQVRSDGLGLSISRKVARMMQGELVAESSKGDGSTFILTLPLDRADPQRNVVNLPQPLSAGAPSSVLIVEDNNINRSVLKEMLTGLGHQTKEVENGLEGLKAADAKKFDIIIMDISMPFMDGIEATRRIREGSGPNKNTYILGLTAHGRQEYKKKAKSAGMNGFTTKPLRLSGLRENLEKAFEQQNFEEAGVGPLDADVLTELVEALGPEIVSETAQQFYIEFNAAFESLERRAPEKESTAISETLHKLRGAAALIGLQDVCAHTDVVGEANDSGDPAKYADALIGLQDAKAKSEQAVSKLLSKMAG